MLGRASRAARKAQFYLERGGQRRWPRTFSVRKVLRVLAHCCHACPRCTRKTAHNPGMSYIPGGFGDTWNLETTMLPRHDMNPTRGSKGTVRMLVCQGFSVRCVCFRLSTGVPLRHVHRPMKPLWYTSASHDGKSGSIIAMCAERSGERSALLVRELNATFPSYAPSLSCYNSACSLGVFALPAVQCEDVTPGRCRVCGGVDAATGC